MNYRYYICVKIKYYTIIIQIIHTLGIESISIRLVIAVLKVFIFCDVTWFINCWICSTGVNGVIIVVLNGLTFKQGLEFTLLSKDLNIKYINFCIPIEIK